MAMMRSMATNMVVMMVTALQLLGCVAEIGLGLSDKFEQYFSGRAAEP